MGKFEIKQLRRIFFPKNFQEKFSHVGYSHLGVPGPWKPHAMSAIKDIEKLMWPQWWLPMWTKRLIHYLATGWSVVRLNYRFWYNIRERLTKGCIIRDVKDKYASIRIYLSGTEEMYNIVRKAEELCSITCERCGFISKSVINHKESGWVYNLCKKCKKNEEDT